MMKLATYFLAATALVPASLAAQTVAPHETWQDVPSIKIDVPATAPAQPAPPVKQAPPAKPTPAQTPTTPAAGVTWTKPRSHVCIGGRERVNQCRHRWNA